MSPDPRRAPRTAGEKRSETADVKRLLAEHSIRVRKVSHIGGDDPFCYVLIELGAGGLTSYKGRPQNVISLLGQQQLIEVERLLYKTFPRPPRYFIVWA